PPSWPPGLNCPRRSGRESWRWSRALESAELIPRPKHRAGPEVTRPPRPAMLILGHPDRFPRARPVLDISATAPLRRLESPEPGLWRLERLNSDRQLDREDD